MSMKPDIPEIIQHFQFEGRFLDAVPYGLGHINDTYAIRFQLPDGRIQRYILQRINHNVFKRPDQVMHNMERVTAHLRTKIIAAGGDPDREAISLIPAVDGTAYYVSTAGDYWRVQRFIEGAKSYQVADSLDIYYAAAGAYGRFLRMLDDFPADELYATIPDFHHTPKRFQTFERSVGEDRAGRVASVQGEIDFIFDRAKDANVLMDLYDQGLMPDRVTHNDTKFENVMIDDESGRGVCVIDLDTVMPGFAVFDFGDSVRSGATTAAEDEPVTSKVHFDLAVFERLAQGFLEETRDVLTPVEVGHLAFGARLITFEQAIRFLTDYLDGDVYYKTSHERHNLDRCRTQIKLVSEMEDHFEEMNRIVQAYAG
jgi:hypothetical protein